MTISVKPGPLLVFSEYVTNDKKSNGNLDKSGEKEDLKNGTFNSQNCRLTIALQIHVILRELIFMIS